jgi:hypothetical protein
MVELFIHFFDFFPQFAISSDPIRGPFAGM